MPELPLTVSTQIQLMNIDLTDLNTNEGDDNLFQPFRMFAGDRFFQELQHVL